ncbi:monooxygenase [Pholiota conissans]|uniref:Monooxygenase n=1 Tax=Pholiota conissans TaxID=109636 RepID=A0A9P5ZFG6_9AGAR|nr:monooxygenase [Pholiota conissans]
MSTPQSPKVLIVGAGPSGLILALSLRRNGIPVRVIEKTTEHRKGQRGAGIMPRSLEVFGFLGLLPQMSPSMIDVPLLTMYKMPEGVEIVEEMAMVPHLEPTPSIPNINMQLLGQDNTDKIFRAELEKSGCEVELGVELQHLEQFDDHVKVSLLKHSLDEKAESIKEEASYEWVIGADGAKGAVRREMGLKLLGETTPHNFVTGDFRLEGLQVNRWHIWGDMETTMVSIRPTENPGVFNFLISGSQLEDTSAVCASHETVIHAIKAHIGKQADTVTFGEILYLSPGRINIRMAETFHEGRTFLVGDAGHVHSQTGGQGMNTGVQDGFNLGWKLALVLKGHASPSLLDTFNEERIPVVAQMLQITEKLLDKTAHNEAGGWERSGHLNQLGVNYRWSSIVLDEERELKGPEFAKITTYDADTKFGVYAGDRAPDAPGLVRIAGAETRLFELFDPTRHTVLVFSNNPDDSLLAGLNKYSGDLIQFFVITEGSKGMPEVAQVDGKSAEVLEDKDGHAYATYMRVDATRGIYIIRPDGVVGARVESLDGVQRYFSGIFLRN